MPGQLIITERSNAIETVNLNATGAVMGTPSMVANIPANVNAPFGLITDGHTAYVAIAHANEISVVRNDSVIATAEPGQQQAPCWLALDGRFLYSSNSPSLTVSRFVVGGNTIVLDKEVAATFSGKPTDIAYAWGHAAVIDSNGTVSHLTLFDVDENGNLNAPIETTIDVPAANGVTCLAYRG